MNAKVLDIAKSVQPYMGSDSGKRLEVLRELDNFDKHREFVVTVVAVERATTDLPRDTTAGSVMNAKMRFTGQPIEHDKVVLRVVYDPPMPKPDPKFDSHPVHNVRPASA